MAHLKKIIRCAAAAALTLSLVTGMAAAAFGTGTVTASSLRLRKEATTASRTLACAKRGTEVEVLEDAENGWYKVSYNGTVGYMSAEYLTVTPAPAEEEPEEDSPAAEAPAGTPAENGDATVEEPTEEAPAEEADTTVYGRVTTEVLNVRKGPGTSYSRVGKVYAGALVTITETLDGWYHITTDKLDGYVSADYVNIIDPEAAAAAATKGAQLAELAKQYLGVPYVYGGASPSGFDCSGLIYYLTKSMGDATPRTATAQWNAGYTKVSRDELQPGDLVFFTNTYHSSKYITHVGIYIGDGNFIHSSSPTSGGVIITALSNSYYSLRFVGGRRLFD